MHSLSILAQDRIDGVALEDYVVVDTSRLVVTYEMLQTRDVQKPSEKVYDYALLEVGKQTSYYHSKYLVSFDSTYTSALKKGARGIPPANGDLYPFEICKNHSGKTMQVFYRARMQGIFSYEEKLNEMTWVWLMGKKPLRAMIAKKRLVRTEDVNGPHGTQRRYHILRVRGSSLACRD